MNLLQLPVEIIVDILLGLNVPDAYAIQAVNHFFQYLYKTSASLQYALECKIAHVRDNPNCHLPIQERLQMLRDRESAWSSLTPTSKRTARYLGIPMDFSASDYLPMQPNHCALHKILGSSASMRPITSHIMPIRGIEKSHFHPIQVENMVEAGYCIDEHDLVACLTSSNLSDSRIELRLVLLQHSTGNAHPLAMEPNILVSRNVLSKTLYRIVAEVLEIFGENLVLTLTFMDDVDRVWMYVYNWKTGEAKCEHMRVPNAKVAVLDHNLVIIPDNDEWSLCIFYIPSSSSGGPIKIIQRLKLPSGHRGWSLYDPIRCGSLPNPTGDGRFPKHVSSSIPFMDQPDTALIHVSIPDKGTMFTHRHSIMKLLPPPEDWSAVTKPLILDWDSWGPPVTALMHIFATTYGQRSLHWRSGLCSLDFNKYHVRRSNKAKQPHIFFTVGGDIVTSKLPYVEIFSPNPSFFGICLADGAVIQTKVRPFLTDRHAADAFKDEGKSIEVLYFGQ